MTGGRVVIPKELRTNILEELHVGHLGIKQLLGNVRQDQVNRLRRFGRKRKERKETERTKDHREGKRKSVNQIRMKVL
ncbi:unnamed protein product [Haemonchus placei]|uniref:40S ribosomal protein S15 n=1 Tax=Haemonchus placei TaxID=6290 RepID=A0A0N4WEH6_HAEPC|nr:unnamed protein product [Haemonchus placei]